MLFIAAEDLRPELGCYGKTKIRSPHLDHLPHPWSSIESMAVTGACSAAFFPAEITSVSARSKQKGRSPALRFQSLVAVTRTQRPLAPRAANERASRPGFG